MVRLFWTVLVSLALAACASTEVANTELLEQQAIKLANESQMTPEEAIAAAQAKFDAVDSAQVRRCAPLHMQKAEESLAKARQLLAGGEPVALVLEQSFQTQRLLEAAQSTAALVHDKLAASLAHQAILDELNVEAELPKEYRKVMSKQQNIIQEVEAGFVDKAVAGETKVLAAMTELEIDALKHRYMAAVDKVLDRAYEADADEYAEATLEVALLKVKDANQFIETNYRDRDGVKRVAEEALAAAEHAFYVARDAVRLMDLEPEQAEQWVLKMEALLQQINQPMNQGPVTGRSLEDQAYTISRRVKSLYDRGATAFGAGETSDPLSVESVSDDGAVPENAPEETAVPEVQKPIVQKPVVSESLMPTKESPMKPEELKPEEMKPEQDIPAAETRRGKESSSQQQAQLPQSEAKTTEPMPEKRINATDANKASAQQSDTRAARQETTTAESETDADTVFDEATVEQKIEAGEPKPVTVETIEDKPVTDDGWIVE